MKPKQFPGLLANSAVWALALGWVVRELSRGYSADRDEIYLLFATIAVVGVSDFLEVDLRGGRSTAVSNSIVFALFVVLGSPVEVLIVILPAFLGAMVVRARRLGWGPRFRSSSRRLVSIMLALGIYQSLVGRIPPLSVGRGELLSEILAMVVGGAVYLLVDTGLSALLISRAQHVPMGPIWQGQLRNLTPLHVAFLSVSALIALAHDVLGLWAFALFLLPLLAARYSFRRYAQIHRTYAQTIKALSTLPELAGYAPLGHSSKVADLAVNIARDRGFPDPDVQEVEFAAYLHDVGRLSFEDPSEVPESVTGTPQAQVLADASASIVGQTPYLDRVAKLVRHHSLPFTESRDAQDEVVRSGSRIVRAVNDFVELSENGPHLPPLLALHQLELEAGTVYDPAIVRSLRRILELRGTI